MAYTMFFCADWDVDHYEELMPVTNTAPARCLLSTILESQSINTLVLIFSQMDLQKYLLIASCGTLTTLVLIFSQMEWIFKKNLRIAA
jgi:hypothetical protein